MDCLLIKNYLIELFDKLFFWTESAKTRERENIGKEEWDLMEEDIPEDNLNKSINDDEPM